MKSVKFFILLMVCIQLNAQTVFLKSYGNENSNSIPNHANDDDGNTFITGGFYGDSMQVGDITLTSEFEYTPYIAKIDPDGNVEWAFTEASAGEPTIYDIEIDNAGNIITCGYFYAADAVFSGIVLTDEGNSGFIAKYDKDGNILWAKSVPGYSILFKTIAIDHNNEIIVGGSNAGELSFLGEEVPYYGENDAVYAKFNQAGEPLWMRSFGSEANEFINTIACDNAGGIYASMYYDQSFSFEAFNIIAGELGDQLIVKTDTDGEPIWFKSIAGVGDPAALNGIIADDANDIYFCMSATQSELYDGMLLDNYGGQDAYIFKIHGDDGALSWYKHGGGSTNDYAVRIAIGSSGVFITGSFQGAAEFDGLQLYADFVNTFVAAFQLNGDISQVYSATGTSFVVPDGLGIDAHGNVYCSGSYYENIIVDGAEITETAGSNDIFLYKFNSALVPIENNDISEVEISLYPNPASDVLTLNLTDANYDEYIVSIINSSGEVVIKDNYNSLEGGQSINVRNLSIGVYTISIRTNTGASISRTFIKI